MDIVSRDRHFQRHIAVRHLPHAILSGAVLSGPGLRRGENGENLGPTGRQTRPARAQGNARGRIGTTHTRKVSARLIPFLIVCYFVAYLDRVNVGFAAITMNQNLGLTSKMFGSFSVPVRGLCLPFQGDPGSCLEGAPARAMRGHRQAGVTLQTAAGSP